MLQKLLTNTGLPWQSVFLAQDRRGALDESLSARSLQIFLHLGTAEIEVALLCTLTALNMLLMQCNI